MTKPKITEKEYNKYEEQGIKDAVIMLMHGINKQSSLSRSKRVWREKALKNSRAKTVVKAQCIVEKAEKLEQKIPKLDEIIEEIEENSLVTIKKDTEMKQCVYNTVIGVCKAVDKEVADGNIPNLQALGILLKAVKDD